MDSNNLLIITFVAVICLLFLTLIYIYLNVKNKNATTLTFLSLSCATLCVAIGGMEKYLNIENHDMFFVFSILFVICSAIHTYKIFKGDEK